VDVTGYDDCCRYCDDRAWYRWNYHHFDGGVIDMASFVYWIIGLLAIGGVLGLVNSAFTSRSETNIGKYLSYQEVLMDQTETSMAQVNDIESPAVSFKAVSVVPESHEEQSDFSVSVIPEEMEDSISELLASLDEIPSSEIQSIVEVKSEAWDLATETETVNGANPFNDEIDAAIVFSDMADDDYVLEFTESDMSVPEGY